MKRDDLVIDDTNGVLTIGLVLAIGPRSVDVIEQCGGTTRYKRALCPFRIPSDVDLVGIFHRDAVFERRVRDALSSEAVKARDERRRGAGICRGHIWRR